MDTHTGASRDAHRPAAAPAPAPRDPSCDAIGDDSPPLSAVFVLVEDLEYLWQTGTSRQTLRMRWTR